MSQDGEILGLVFAKGGRASCFVGLLFLVWEILHFTYPPRSLRSR